MTRDGGALDGGWLSLTTSPNTRSTALPEAVSIAAARRSSNTNSSSGSGSGVSTVRQRRTSAGASGQPQTAHRRRSSSLSDYSQEARELLDPTPAMAAADALRQQRPTSGWDSLPLAFALLPALGGLLVQGGSAFVTDLMLLALGAIFLHWSVTQPWVWYHSARQVREDQQTSVDCAVESDVDIGGLDDSDGVDGKDTARSTSPNTLEDVPEEGEEGEGTAKKTEQAKKTKREAADEAKSQEHSQRAGRLRFRAGQEAALRELHRHEVLALLSCFVAPVLGAYLLHGLRGQLTRPSEGLISSYNLTIFILGAEVRPLRHLIQLVRARTLHLQRVVNANPYREEEERYRKRRAEEEKAQNETLAGVIQRLADLEGHVEPGLAGLPSNHSTDSRREHAQLLLDLRTQLQPELDMLAHALQRTHKQQTLLEGQMAGLRQATDKLVGEAASLARASSQQKRNNRLWKTGFGPFGVVGAAWNAVLRPFRTALAALLYVPRRAVALLLSVKLPAQIPRADKTNGTSSNKTKGGTTFYKVIGSKRMNGD